MDSKSTPLDFDVLNRICDRAFYQALKMIDLANKRPVKEKAEPKVGGHATACSSSQHILSAIHLVARNPEDYVACKPHVSPMDHALNFQLGNFRHHDTHKRFTEDESKKVMHHLRHFSSSEPVFQSYHAETDPDFYRFYPSGSVGIPPVNALYTALAYDFAKDHGFHTGEDPYFWCLMGDSEFREGSLAEAMPDAGERQLKNVVWIVDYNRQNLDGTRVTNEVALDGSDADRIKRIATANGWNALALKHGSLRKKLFETEGGAEFKRVLDEVFTDFEFQGVIEANRPELTWEVLTQKSEKLAKWLQAFTPEEIHQAFLNLGGHDLPTLVDAMERARKSEKPTLIVAYTIKGFRLRCQAKSGNHSTLPEQDELTAMADNLGISDDDPFIEFSKDSPEAKYLEARRSFLVDGIDQILATVRDRQEKWVEEAKSWEWPTDMGITALKLSPMAHTQWMWGQIAAKLDRLARGREDEPNGWEKAAKFFLTMAPDVGSSTNTSPNMNGKVFGDIGQEDFQQKFETKDTKAPDVIPIDTEITGHIRFEIAEGNCMSAAGSFGKMFHYTGFPFLPAMTVYDFFIKRALDQYYYNVYWKSNFVSLGTPSGITLAPEGAQHSWKSDIQMPNSVTWEPYFAKELDWIYADLLRRHFTQDHEGRQASLIRCVTKGVPQKEFLARLKQQQQFAGQADESILETTRQHVLEGAYRLIDYTGQDDYVPGDNVVHLFAMGALGTEAIRASDKLREQGIFANVFIVTSPDLLLGNFAYQNQYQHLRETLGVNADLHLVPNKQNQIEHAGDWASVQGSRIPIVSVHDGEPGLLDNIGSAVGVKHEALAVRKASKSGTTWDIFAYHHLDSDSIAEAAQRVLAETAVEKFQIHRRLLQQ